MLLKTRNRNPSVCPKTGKYLGHSRRYLWLRWLFPITGLLSLIWFLVRVVPKPSRAMYPCQRVAAPLASGFVVWITGLVGSALAYRKARRLLHQSRYFVAAVFAVAGVMMVWWSLSISAGNLAGAGFTPSDPPNNPMGVAKGIHPGRVVWIYDANATSWNGTTGSWWSDTNTNQLVVNSMMSKAIQYLTCEVTDAKAWDALFRHFNRTNGFGDVGYQVGEKITIKINMNQQDNWNAWAAGAGMPSPQAIYALLDQLINVVGVPGSAITIYDAARYIGDPIYNKVRSNPNFQSITFVVKSGLAGNGRIAAAHDAGNPLYTQGPPTAYLPTCVTQAKYLINMALLRPHQLYGVTLCGKNNFGSVYFPNNGGWTPSPLHNYGGRSKAMNTYNCLVELNGHRHLGGKTLLYMVDGLYPAVHQGGNVVRWQTFGNDWCSSIFASQDPVAIDSVGTDFLRTEPACNADVIGNPDNYLHEAARANSPPSGTVYDPEHDGIRLASLGVHEHWNNQTDRKYTRNLMTGNGIELVTQMIWTNPDGPVQNLTAGKRYNYIQYAINDAQPGNQIVVGKGVYYENIDFKGKNLTISSTNPNDPNVVADTVINGGSQGWVVTFPGGEDANCVLGGFTITGGEKGIYCSSSSSPTISSCTIDENGSVAIESARSIKPVIIDCTIIGEVRVREVENLNTGEKYDYVQDAVDGAAAGDHIAVGKGTYQENIDFKGKRVTVSSTNPNDSTIVADTIIKGGNAAVTFSSGEDANSVLSGLTIAGGSRGIYCSGSTPTITGCIVAENTAQGIYVYGSDLTLTHCIIARNAGAGVAAEGGSELVIIDCTIAGNRGSGITVSMSTAEVVNSIVWGNSPKQITSFLSTILINYSDVQGGWTGQGQNNINVDPYFADAAGGDYHLQSAAGRWVPQQNQWVPDANTSLCIDAGDPNSDWTAELWPHGKCINMGAYGGTPQASMSLSDTGNIADLNNDNTVGLMDFAIFADSWLIEQVLMAENLDRTGLVDINDLAVFIENWLWQEQ